MNTIEKQPQASDLIREDGEHFTYGDKVRITNILGGKATYIGLINGLATLEKDNQLVMVHVDDIEKDEE